MFRNKGHQKKQHEYSHGDKEVPSVVDENSVIHKMFKSFAKELDDKHDRYERVVKLSRDITIESKRIIFALHTTLDNSKPSVFGDIKKRLECLINKNFRDIAVELHCHDANQYHRAYTSGMQEFIEALVFYQYLTKGEIEPWKIVNRNFTYQHLDDKCLYFSQYDFILGIADSTGELMRRCISSLGTGNPEDCFKLCDCVKQINTGFLGIISPGHKEIGKKVYTLKQSLSKMELVCYNLTIRGSEIPKHMLVNVLEQQENNDVDEGYF